MKNINKIHMDLANKEDISPSRAKIEKEWDDLDIGAFLWISLACLAVLVGVV